MEGTSAVQRRVVSRHVEIFHSSGPTNNQHKKRRYSKLYGRDIQETKYRLKPEPQNKQY